MCEDFLFLIYMFHINMCKSLERKKLFFFFTVKKNTIHTLSLSMHSINKFKQAISSNNKIKSLCVNLCANSRLNGKFYWYQISYGDTQVWNKNISKSFFFSKIYQYFFKFQILINFFSGFFITLFLIVSTFFLKHCTFSFLTASNRMENSLLNTSCCIMITKFLGF